MFSIDRRNMEPPDALFIEKHYQYLIQINIQYTSGIKCTQFVFLTYEEVMALSGSIRICGGTTENPNTDEKTNEIPYLRDSRFFWSGLPCIDFMELIMFPLENGLASMSVKGYSLLDAVNRTDAGGVLGNPARVVAPPDIVAESEHRNKKAFACTMNYIKRGSFFYKMAMRHFNHDGIQVIRAIRNFGVIPTPPRILKSREDTWQRMSMEVLRIPYDQAGFFVWCDVVYENGRKLAKNGDQQLDKFISGLPMWFSAEKAQMRHDTSADLMHPATWGDLYPGMPNGALAHPLAAQPNVYFYGKKYFADWCDKSSMAGKEPNFSVRSIIDCSSIDDITDIVKAVTVEDVTPKMRCNICDGTEHPASITLPDGTKHECLKRVIQRYKGVIPSASENDKNVKSFEKRAKFQAKQIEELQDQLEELQMVANRASDFSSNFKARKNIAKQAVEEPSDEDASEAEETSDSASDSSRIQEMADAVQMTKRKPFKPFKRR